MATKAKASNVSTLPVVQDLNAALSQANGIPASVPYIEPTQSQIDMVTACGKALIGIKQHDDQSETLRETMSNNTIELHKAGLTIGIRSKNGCKMAHAFYDSLADYRTVKGEPLTDSTKTKYLNNFRQAVKDGQGVTDLNNYRKDIDVVITPPADTTVPPVDGATVPTKTPTTGELKSKFADKLKSVFNANESGIIETMLAEMDSLIAAKTCANSREAWMYILRSEGYRFDVINGVDKAVKDTKKK